MDWTYLLAFASIVGSIANIYKKQWCFIIWLITNSTWVIVDFSMGLRSQAILFVVNVIISVMGLIAWRKQAKKKSRTD